MVPRPRALWALSLGPLPCGVAHNLTPMYGATSLSSLGHKPQLYASTLDLMPNGPVALTQSHFKAQCVPLQIRCSLDKYKVARGYISRLPSIALAKVPTKHPIEVGTNSNATITSTHGTPTKKRWNRTPIPTNNQD